MPPFKKCCNCNLRKTVTRVDDSSGRCFKCLGVCRKCKLPIKGCSCVGKQAKHRSVVVNSSCYRNKNKISATGRIIFGLFRMHSQGTVKQCVRKILSLDQCDQYLKHIELNSMALMNKFDGTDGGDSFRLEKRMFSSVDCIQDQSLKEIYEAISDCHPAISDMNVSLEVMLSGCSPQPFHCDFSLNKSRGFTFSSLSLLIALSANENNYISIQTQDKYKNGTNKDVETAKLRKGDGLLFRGNLLYAIGNIDSGAFLHCAFESKVIDDEELDSSEESDS